LRNGDRVTGEIVSETATEVTLRSGALGKVTIPVGEILKREQVVAKTAAPAPSTNVVTVTPPTGVTNAPSATAKAPVVKPKHWNSELQFGLNLRYSTRDQQEALIVAKSTYSNGRFREILDYNYAYGETEGVLSANRMSGSSKTEWDIKPKVYAFGLAGAGYDEIRKIDRSFEVNPGVGYQWIKKPELVFKTEVGLGYQDQFFADGREVNAYSGRLAGIFTWRIWDKLIADGRAEYFPNISAVDEYRLRFESTLRYPLLKNLSLNLIVLDLYDTQAPAKVENNDLQVRSAIGVKF
jgi:putative salt-induced outer membrane protein YdiY